MLSSVCLLSWMAGRLSLAQPVSESVLAILRMLAISVLAISAPLLYTVLLCRRAIPALRGGAVTGGPSRSAAHSRGLGPTRRVARRRLALPAGQCRPWWARDAELRVMQSVEAPIPTPSRARNLGGRYGTGGRGGRAAAPCVNETWKLAKAQARHRLESPGYPSQGNSSGLGSRT